MPQHRYLLTEDKIPTALVQHRRGSADADAAAAGPRREPAAAGDDDAHLPDGADPPGGQPGALDHHPGPGARGLCAVAPDAAAPRRRLRARARNRLQDLLQVRGLEPGRLAQAQHLRRRRPTTTPRPGIRRLATETGAGQWGSSLALACQLFGLECKVYMVRVSYDSKPYRRVMIETWGGECVPARRRRPTRAARSWPSTRTRPAAWASRSPRPSRTPRPARTPTTPSAACSTTCCCTRPWSARRRSSRCSWPGHSRTSSSAASAAARTSPGSRSRSWPRSSPAPTSRSSRPSRRRARA